VIHYALPNQTAVTNWPLAAVGLIQDTFLAYALLGTMVLDWLVLANVSPSESVCNEEDVTCLMTQPFDRNCTVQIIMDHECVFIGKLYRSKESSVI
jgi:hypothetical protein